MEQDAYLLVGVPLVLMQVCASLLLFKQNSKYATIVWKALWLIFRMLCPSGKDAAAPDDESSIEEEVAIRMRTRRGEMFRALLGCASMFLCGVHALHLHNNSKSIRWSTVELDVVFGVFSVLVAAAILCPGICTSGRLPYYASAMYFVLILSITYPACPPCLAGRVDNWLLLPRTLLSLCAMPGPLAASWSLVYFFALSYNILAAADCPVPVAIKEDIVIALSRALLTCLLVFVFELYAKEDMRTDIKNNLSRSELKALGSLMDLMCDVVVELDSDLTVSKNAEKLAVVLFQRPASVEGRHLKYIVYNDEDQQSLVDRLGQMLCGGGGRSAQVFHLPVKDGQGNKISMEFFHVCFPHLREVRHIVGLRELSDVVAMGDAPPTQEVAELQPAPGEAPVSPMSGPSQRLAVPRQVTITIDATSFAVVQCSQGFRLWFGEPPSTLTDWFHRPTGLEEQFQASYREALDEFINNFELQGTQVALGDVILQLPSAGGRQRLPYRVSCAVLFFSMTVDKFVEFPGQVMAQLELQGLQAKSRGRPSSRSSSSSSLSSGTRGSARQPTATGTFAAVAAAKLTSL